MAVSGKVDDNGFDKEARWNLYLENFYPVSNDTVFCAVCIMTSDALSGSVNRYLQKNLATFRRRLAGHFLQRLLHGFQKQ